MSGVNQFLGFGTFFFVVPRKIGKKPKTSKFAGLGGGSDIGGVEKWHVSAFSRIYTSPPPGQLREQQQTNLLQTMLSSWLPNLPKLSAMLHVQT